MFNRARYTMAQGYRGGLKWLGSRAGTTTTSGVGSKAVKALGKGFHAIGQPLTRAGEAISGKYNPGLGKMVGGTRYGRFAMSGTGLGLMLAGPSIYESISGKTPEVNIYTPTAAAGQYMAHQLSPDYYGYYSYPNGFAPRRSYYSY